MDLQESDRIRFETLKQTVKSGLAVCFTVGAALQEIKESEFYLADGYKTFDEFCTGEWGWTKRYCNQLIVDAKTIKGLPSEMRKLITSHAAASELSKVPASLREIVIDCATEGGTKSATAASIRKTSPPPPAKKVNPKPLELPYVPPKVEAEEINEHEPEHGPMDETDLELPREIRAAWEESECEARDLTFAISEIISKVEKIREAKLVGFAEVDFNANLSNLRHVFKDLQRGIPHAVCHSCQGKAPAKCQTCKGRGFVSKFFWTTCVPDEIKKLRGGK